MFALSASNDHRGTERQRPPSSKRSKLLLEWLPDEVGAALRDVLSFWKYHATKVDFIVWGDWPLWQWGYTKRQSQTCGYFSQLVTQIKDFIAENFPGVDFGWVQYHHAQHILMSEDRWHFSGSEKHKIQHFENQIAQLQNEIESLKEKQSVHDTEIENLNETCNKF